MKAFLLKMLLLISIAALVMIPVAWRFNSGYVDPFYTRFTTDEAPSLIIGTSRAAQGLLPQEFHELAPKMQNFAFTVTASPFGPAYLDLIKRKLDEEAENGLFILAVDPWAVASIFESEIQVENFREQERFTNGIHIVNMNPNYEYILRYYDEPIYNVFDDKWRPMKLHKDGWLEVNVPLDTANMQANISKKIEIYKQYVKEGAISQIRMRALEETVSFLKQYGRVYLVRIPVSPEMVALEKEFAPEFDVAMQEIASKFSIPYLNYIRNSGEYLTTDGNHLYKEDGKEFSKRVALDISKLTQVSQSNTAPPPASPAAANASL